MAKPPSGREGQIKLGENVVQELKEWKMNQDSEMAEGTSKTATYAYSYPGIIKAATVECKCLFDPTDTNGQLALDEAFRNRTLIQDVKLVCDGASGYYALDLVEDPTAGVYVKKRDIGSPESGPMTGDFTLQATGPLKYFAY